MSASKNRKLSAILFADIVGYTALMQKDEVTANQNLEKFHQTLFEKVSQYKGQIINNYGDGCVCTFDSAVDAMYCAMETQYTFQTAPKVPVRIGLHSGDVYFKDDNVYGDSVNIASRIESLGIAGTVLFSKRIKRDIANQTAFKVKSLGMFDFKNVEKTMEVFALANDKLVIPVKSQMKGKSTSKKTNWNPMPKGFGALVILFTILSLGIAFLSPLLTKEKPVSKKDTKLNKKSIAVLPFKNWSGEEELQYFVDGMTDEVIARLTKISAFEKVTSRTSVFKYKNSDKSIPEIAQELGVNHILEGSFQKVGKQVKVKLQLIDATTDNHFWSDEYGGQWDSDDIFKIQTDVAENVAKNMEVTISSSEIASLQQKPTENKQAYDLFLLAEFQRYKHNEQSYLNAIPLYEQAIELDTNFTKAYAGLGYTYLNGGLIWGVFPEQEAAEKSRYYFKKALAIQPYTFVEFSLFAVEFYFNWNFDYCEQYVKKRGTIKVEKDPEADGIPDYLMKTGRYDSAMVWINQCIAEYPLTSFAYGFKAKALLLNGQEKEALKILAKSDKIFNNDQWYLREAAIAHLYLGNYEASQKNANFLNTNFSDRSAAHIWLDAVHAHINQDPIAATRYIEEIKGIMNKKASGSPAWFISMYYFFLKKEDKGFQWLAKSFEHHEVEMTWLKEEPLLRPYRNDARYKKIYATMKWPIIKEE